MPRAGGLRPLVATGGIGPPGPGVVRPGSRRLNPGRAIGRRCRYRIRVAVFGAGVAVFIPAIGSYPARQVRAGALCVHKILIGAQARDAVGRTVFAAPQAHPVAIAASGRVGRACIASAGWPDLPAREAAPCAQTGRPWASCRAAGRRIRGGHRDRRLRVLPGRRRAETRVCRPSVGGNGPGAFCE